MLASALAVSVPLTLTAAAAAAAPSAPPGPPAAPPGGPLVLPANSTDHLVEELRDDVVAYYDFSSPVPGDPATERDQGPSGTDLWLVNGGLGMRTDDGAYPASLGSVQTRQVAPDTAGNDDWKVGVFAADGVASLRPFNATDAVTIMGWFQATGDHPKLNSNTPDPDDRFNAVGLAGVLSGDSDGHGVRALLEIIDVDGELRLVGLARRLDHQPSNILYALDDWEELLPRDTWVHLTATFDFTTGEMALYKDGEPLDAAYTRDDDPWEVEGDGPHRTSPTDPAGIKIGGSYPQNTREQNPCDCRFDALLFLDRVVTPDEVAAQYAAFVDAPVADRELPAGRTVPVRADLGGHPTAEVTSHAVSCADGRRLGDDAAIVTGGTPRTTPDGVLRTTWRTDRDWAGTCRQLAVTTDDGTVLATRVAFR